VTGGNGGQGGRQRPRVSAAGPGLPGHPGQLCEPLPVAQSDFVYLYDRYQNVYGQR
jgi:hypothetical protein